MPIIIKAQIDLEPEGAAQALKDAQPLIEASRAEDGCVAYDWGVDPAKPGRVYVYEEWRDEEALAGHFRDPSYANMRDHIGRSGLVTAYSQKARVDLIEQIYDKDGVPQAFFGKVG
jgi:quinol monooxygenase YgiN